MRTIFVAVLLATTAFSAPLPRGSNAQGELEGTWEIIAMTSFGGPVQGETMYWTIDSEGNMKMAKSIEPPKGAVSTVRFAIDPKLKTIDYILKDGDKASYPGVYELSKDSLTFCFNLRGSTRPKSIEAGSENSTHTWTFKRVKPEDKK